MNNFDVKNCLKVVACICGKDGMISESEENKMFQLLTERFPSFSSDDFESGLDNFFNSFEQIEDYLLKIKDVELQNITINIAKTSASIDGLDIAENIALQKAYLVWGIDPHE